MQAHGRGHKDHPPAVGGLHRRQHGAARIGGPKEVHVHHLAQLSLAEIRSDFEALQKKAGVASDTSLARQQSKRQWASVSISISHSAASASVRRRQKERGFVAIRLGGLCAHTRALWQPSALRAEFTHSGGLERLDVVPGAVAGTGWENPLGL